MRSVEGVDFFDRILHAQHLFLTLRCEMGSSGFR